MCGSEKSKGPVRRDVIEVRPRKLRGACCPEHRPACFGVRLVNGHVVRPQELGWLVGCFGFSSPLRQYFSLYQAVSQREGER